MWPDYQPEHPSVSAGFGVHSTEQILTGGVLFKGLYEQRLMRQLLVIWKVSS